MKESDEEFVERMAQIQSNYPRGDEVFHISIGEFTRLLALARRGVEAETLLSLVVPATDGWVMCRCGEGAATCNCLGEGIARFLGEKP